MCDAEGAMRALAIAAGILALSAAPQRHRFYASAAASKGYVVGMKLPPSGLFFRDADVWKQLGFTHPFVTAVDYDPRDPRVMYLAAGNGCIRSADGGATWRILTGWDMTEIRDVSVDATNPDHVYVALPDGIGVSRDQGRTWSRKDAGIERKYTGAIRADRTRAGRVMAGTERGLFLTEDGGDHWRPAGTAMAMITHLAQAPGAGTWWIATSQSDGAFTSHDGGVSWTRVAGIPPEQTLHQTAFDPAAPGRVAICGWALGVAVSEDGGKSWQSRNEGLPSHHVWRVAFDPDHAGRLYAGVLEEALYVSDDAGRSWKRGGLEGTMIHDLAFIPVMAK
jgi:photosystem II stability/assembly factor-like uncharacterized protein